MDGRVYYANHQTRSTQWQHPVTNKQKTLSGELPYGWEKLIVEEKILFVDHINKRTSYTDPRLAFAKTAKNNSNQNRMNYAHNFNDYTTALEVIRNRDFTGYNAIVTGANRGVGFEITRALSYMGCYVIMACRNVTEGLKASELLSKDRPDIKIEVIELDLSDLRSVKLFADKLNARKMNIHMLYLNAAIFERDHKLSKDNIELMFQVNFLAQFYLTRLLMPILKATKNARVVVIACESHRGADLNKGTINANQLNTSKNDYNFLQVYCNTKLLNILFANELNRRLNILNSDVICKSCHPGNLLPTKLFQSWTTVRFLSLLTNRFSKSLEQAAAAPIYIGTTSKLSRDCFYWNGFSECNASLEANDSVLAYRVWEIAESLLIDRTQSFDNFLAVGDKLSSYTLIETDKSVSSNSESLNNYI